jgi:prophage regulatory protein
MSKLLPQISTHDVVGNRVRSLSETAAAAGISLATLRRRIADGTGPRVVRLSTRRVGIRESDFGQWLDNRTQDVPKTS